MKESDYFTSEEFQKSYREQVEKDTWEKGLPMIYKNEEGQIVEHWKDGTINILKKSERNSWKDMG